MDRRNFAQGFPVFLVVRAAIGALIVAALCLAGSAPAGAQNDGVSCGHFETQADAQAALVADPSLAEFLDADGDGAACDEAFPGVVVDPTSCGHFESYEAAQAAFDEGTLPNSENLDGDGDGIVCEDAFGAGDGEQVPDSETCSDFASQEEAQAYFDGASATQRNILDPDGDGTACEDAYEGEPVYDYDTCGAYETQDDAQEALDSGSTAYPEFLDGDGDGIACEEAFGAGDDDAASSDSNSAERSVDVQRTSAAVVALPSTGSGNVTVGDDRALVLVAVLMVLGGLALGLQRRIAR